MPQQRREWMSVSAVVLMLVIFCFCARLPAQGDPCALVVPGQVFCDDFEDGSATDGVPVRWSSLFDSTQTTEDGSLVISGGSFPAARVTPVENYSDISIRAQVRLLEGNSIGFSVRGNFAQTGSYGAFIQDDQAIIGMGGIGTTLGSSPVALNPSETDVVLQFDAIGDSLKFWAWSPEEEMPTEPLVSVINDDLQTGQFFIWSSQINPAGPNKTSAFRYIHVATKSIPEPSSLVLLLMSFFGLLTVRRRS